jgi:L,D-transpeptidase ErfK/SrfK
VTLLLTALVLATAFREADISGEEVIGAVGSRVVLPGESLVEIAPQHDLGFNEIEAANPGIDPFVPPPGTRIVIPTSWIIPRAAAPDTLVVNLSEMRLYLFPLEPGVPLSFPIGVAVEPGATPLGTMKVIAKTVNPTWYPTRSIRAEDPDLPAAVPPGPENPLGSHALRLSRPTFLIHGTNKPLGIGRKVTHGCVRLYPEDIQHLYRLVPVGARVTFVREPVKVGLRRGRVYVEAHEDDEARVDAPAEARRLLVSRGLLERVDQQKLGVALRNRTGVPVDVTADPSKSLVSERRPDEPAAAPRNLMR